MLNYAALMTDVYTVKRLQNYAVVIILSNYFPYLRLTLFMSKIPEMKCTSVVQSSGCAHPPLALVHSRRCGALHLHADVSHFLRVK